MLIYIGIYILILLFLIADFSLENQKNKVLNILAIIMVLFIGLRGDSGADSPVYIDFFNYNTDTIWNWKGVEKGYAEYGFYYLSVILKSIWNNIDFYFTSISALTIFFLIRSLKEFSIYPILGFCVYYSRFLIIRDMNQIRQALAMVVIIYAFKLLLSHKKKAFACVILCMTFIHYSSIIVLPFIWLYDKRPHLKQAIAILGISLVAGLIGSIVFKKILIATGYIVFLRYIDTANLGLLNPVLIFQLGICFLFCYFEPILKDRQKGYYIIRNAYLYSTVLLLLTCNMGEIGGRLATIFATCEIFILPALSTTIRPYLGGYIAYLLLAVLLFSMNYFKLLQAVSSWEYFS